MSKQNDPESAWVQYVRPHFEPAPEIEMSYADEGNLLFLLNAPGAYLVEDEMLAYAKANPGITVKELMDYFSQIVPPGLPPNYDIENDPDLDPEWVIQIKRTK